MICFGDPIRSKIGKVGSAQLDRHEPPFFMPLEMGDLSEMTGKSTRRSDKPYLASHELKTFAAAINEANARYPYTCAHSQFRLKCVCLTAEPESTHTDLITIHIDDYEVMSRESLRCLLSSY